MRCWLWHTWERWVTINVITRIYMNGSYVGDNYSMEQRRECKKCGKAQQVRVS